MKKIAVVLVLALALGGCCSHPAEVVALDRAEVEIAKVSDCCLKYVDADPDFGGKALTNEQREKARENEKAWLVRVLGLVVSVKKSLEE